jgi:para-nitrobenzyl esterase
MSDFIQSRRGLAACTAIAILAIGAIVGAAQAQVVARPIAPIAVDGGRIAGKVLDSGVKAWFGIPFVQAPVRELRWKPPQPVKPWTGVYNTDRMGPECIQPLRNKNINHYFGEEPTSEDCLFMNIWAPANARAGAKLPVVVYLYGGGSTIGSSGMALYAGETVAQRGAVFVNFNYRLGILGYMAHPELTAESPNKASGNYAGQDQVAALQWIQRNIHKFGGDPNKVIISGQSAGAGAISALQASPMAKGLFRGVVAMSGGVWAQGGDNMVRLAEAEKIGLQVQTAIKAASVADMRNIAADKLLALQEDCQLGCTAGNIRVGSTIVDGHYMPDTPAKLFAAKRNSDVPVIAGFANDESRNDLSSAKTFAEYEAAAYRLYGPRGAEFLRLYPASTPAEVNAMGRAAAREAMVGRGMRNWALAQSAFTTSPTYMYNLVRVHPFNPAALPADRPDLVGAYHTSDVPYWFGTQDALNMWRPTRNWTPEDRKLSADMTASLIAFANTGSPTTAAIQWPAWTPASEQLVEFNTTGVKAVAMETPRWNFHVANTASASILTPNRGVRD